MNIIGIIALIYLFMVILLSVVIDILSPDPTMSIADRALRLLAFFIIEVVFTPLFILWLIGVVLLDYYYEKHNPTEE